jgi:hypothetical protein
MHLDSVKAEKTQDLVTEEMIMCLDIGKDVHGMKELHSIESATVMDDYSIVLVVSTKNSVLCARYILRFDVRRISGGQ